MEIENLSQTKVNLYIRCPAAYRFRYIMGLTQPPKAALLRGSWFHNAMGFDMRQKIRSHVNLPVGDVLDYYSDGYNYGARRVVWKSRLERAKVKDTGVSMLKLYHADFATAMQPKEVELEFEIQFANRDWRFTGVADLVDETDLLVEMKTTGQRTSAPKGDHVFQVSAYATALKMAAGLDSKEVWPSRIDYIVGTKKPTVLSFPVNVGPSHRQLFLNTVSAVGQAIENGIFYPSRGNYLCSEAWCGYFSRCKHEYGG